LGRTSVNLAFTAPGPKSGITGSVFNDSQMDGKLNTGDSMTAGTKLFLDKNKNGILDIGEPSTTTDANGNFHFTNLGAGAYRVREIIPSGYRTTSPAGYFDVTVPAGGIAGGYYFGLTTQALVSGTLFNDINGNARKDAGESFLSGWKMYIDSNNDGKWQSNERFVYTSSRGAWSFSLPAGSYHIRALRPTGWKLTTTTAESATRSLTSGKILSGILFGVRKG
jgi:hypothetical protein